MDYIVSPLAIYLINVLAFVRIVATVAFIIIFSILVVYMFKCASIEDEYMDSEDRKDMEDGQKLLARVVVFLLISITLIPSRETMYTMLFSQFVTYENASVAVETIKELLLALH